VATDYYAVLGVRRDASQDEIKKAFRRLARELHPDVNPDPKTQERFKEINAAYEVLSDPQKKQVYDLGGDPLSQSGGGGAGGFGAGGFGNVLGHHGRLLRYGVAARSAVAYAAWPGRHDPARDRAGRGGLRHDEGHPGRHGRRLRHLQR
jgi:DnaJ-class molecular chaperone with C-terminal Zn finger domain